MRLIPRALAFLRRWQGFLPIAILAVIAASYIALGPSRPLVLLVLTAACALAFAEPAVAVAMTLGIAPIADGLMALLHGINPIVYRNLGGPSWVEPMFLGATAGILARRAWLYDRGDAPMPEARFYAVSILAVLAVAVAQYVAEWHGRSIYVLLLMWRALPGLSQDAPEHLLRAGLLLMAAPLWLETVASAVHRDNDIRRVRVAWLTAAVLAALYGQWMWMRSEGEVPPRVESFFDDVNSYGSYLVLSLFMAVVVLVDDRRRMVKALAAIALATTTWMLILSGSRIALLAALGAAAAVAPVVMRFRRVVAAVAVVLTLAVVANSRALATAAETSQVLRLVRASTDPSRLMSHFVEMRQAMWSATARAFLSRPLTGIGPGRLYATLGAYFPPDASGFRPQKENAHNYFLQLAAETGVVGVVAFVWLLAAVLIPALRDDTGGLAGRRVLAVAALGYLVTCVSGHPLLLSRQVVIFWGFLGLLVAPSPGPDAPRPSGARAVQWAPWALAAVFLVSVVSGRSKRPCPTGGPAVSVDYGLGFYTAESSGTESWRWMRDAGEVLLCNGTTTTVTADVTVPAISFARPRTVRAYLGSSPGARYMVEGPTQMTWSSIVLPPGWTTLGIVVSPGPRRVDPVLHNGDQRTISIRVGTPVISVRTVR